MPSSISQSDHAQSGDERAKPVNKSLQDSVVLLLVFHQKVTEPVPAGHIKRFGHDLVSLQPSFVFLQVLHHKSRSQYLQKRHLSCLYFRIMISKNMHHAKFVILCCPSGPSPTSHRRPKHPHQNSIRLIFFYQEDTASYKVRNAIIFGNAAGLMRYDFVSEFCKGRIHITTDSRVEMLYCCGCAMLRRFLARNIVGDNLVIRIS